MRNEKDMVKTKEIILKLKILTLVPLQLKKLLWKSLIENENKEPYTKFLTYFWTNYLNEKAPYHNSINYDFNLFKQDRLIRTNNACEGYNNRLRKKNLIHTPFSSISH